MGRDLAAAEFGLGLLGWVVTLLFAHASEHATDFLLTPFFVFFLLGLAWQGAVVGGDAPSLRFLKSGRDRDGRDAARDSRGGDQVVRRSPSLPSVVGLLGLTGVAGFSVLRILLGWSDTVQAGVDGAALCPKLRGRCRYGCNGCLGLVAGSLRCWRFLALGWQQSTFGVT